MIKIISKELVNNGIDVVKTNFPKKVAKSIAPLAPASSSKNKSFSKTKILSYGIK